MPKTLTAVGIEKIGRRFADSVDHAAYTLNGAPKTVKPFRKLIEADTVKIYVYFDDTVSGNVANVQLVDTDGDIIAQTERTFEKPPSKGLYVAFILHEAQIADAQKEIKVLKDATLNNMTNNVFLINFDSVNAVAITSGIYDSVARKLYV